eukprot:gene6255-8945_t
MPGVNSAILVPDLINAHADSLVNLQRLRDFADEAVEDNDDVRREFPVGGKLYTRRRIMESYAAYFPPP